MVRDLELINFVLFFTEILFSVPFFSFQIFFVFLTKDYSLGCYMYSVGEPPLGDPAQPSRLVSEVQMDFIICMKTKCYKYLDKYFYKMRIVLIPKSFYLHLCQNIGFAPAYAGTRKRNMHLIFV